MSQDSGNFEKQLREALGREDAPAGFAARVLAAAAAEKQVRVMPVAVAKLPKLPKQSWMQRPFALAIAATIAALAIVPAVVLDYQRREEARGMKAKQDLMVALSITKNQLQQARAKVQRSSRNTQ